VIEIGGAGNPVAPGLLRAPGGFLWWYADLVTPAGDGAVVIWSYGLPFLPGYASAARRGRAQLPVSRPSVNVVVYRRGRPVFYLLQEHAPAPVDEDALAHTQRIGGCTFHRRGAGGRCTLDAALDLPLPVAGRLTGTLRMEGPSLRGPAFAAPDAEHLWTPLIAPAQGELELLLDGRPLERVAGRAYHDRNTGRVPLHELGIHVWMWGRFPFADRERIYYLLWPEDEKAPPRAIGIDLHRDGRTVQVPLQVELGRERWTFGGLRRPERMVLRHEGEPWLTVRHREVSDAGPFYLRLLSEGAADGESVTGWSELVHPARVDLARHRPFVRMRVHRPGGPNSTWLPLFSGPREGRAARLVWQGSPWGFIRR
jgi:carotenoid 1,2-hydratase